MSGRSKTHRLLHARAIVAHKILCLVVCEKGNVTEPPRSVLEKDTLLREQASLFTCFHQSRDAIAATQAVRQSEMYSGRTNCGVHELLARLYKLQSIAIFKGFALCNDCLRSILSERVRRFPCRCQANRQYPASSRHSAAVNTFASCIGRVPSNSPQSCPGSASESNGESDASTLPTTMSLVLFVNPLVRLASQLALPLNRVFCCCTPSPTHSFAKIASTLTLCLPFSRTCAPKLQYGAFPRFAWRGR